MMRFSAVDPETCQHCGTHVSADFRRIFGDERSVAQRCLACDSRPRIQQGSAAGAEIPYPDPAENEVSIGASRS